MVEPTSDWRTLSTAGKGSFGYCCPLGLSPPKAGSIPLLVAELLKDTGSTASSDEERSSEFLSMLVEEWWTVVKLFRKEAGQRRLWRLSATVIAGANRGLMPPLKASAKCKNASPGHSLNLLRYRVVRLECCSTLSRHLLDANSSPGMKEDSLVTSYPSFRRRTRFYDPCLISPADRFFSPSCSGANTVGKLF